MKSKLVDDQYVAFIYLLLRDYLTAGQLEEILTHIVKEDPRYTKWRLSNNYVAMHAEDVVARLDKVNNGKKPRGST